MKFKDARRTSFAIGDKVKILPSAIDIGVSRSEVGTIQTVTGIMDSETIIITDSSGGEWWVNDYDIAPAIMVGQQLLFEFME